MPGFGLIRRRAIWLPTWRGWLVVVALLAILIASGARGLHAFLSPNEPIGASVLIVEGWLPIDALDQAAEIFAEGEYEWLLTTGGPVVPWAGQLEDTSHAHLAAKYLIAHGVSRARVFVVEAPLSAQNRTFLSAVMVREWSDRAGVPAGGFDVFSLGTHARRTRDLYRLALGPGVPLGIFAALPSTYGPEAWWQSSAGAEMVLTELMSWMWVKCCFWPASPGSQQEKWGRAARERAQQRRFQQPALGSEQKVSAELESSSRRGLGMAESAQAAQSPPFNPLFSRTRIARGSAERPRLDASTDRS